jgi:hypothetical protein
MQGQGLSCCASEGCWSDAQAIANRLMHTIYLQPPDPRAPLAFHHLQLHH